MCVCVCVYMYTRPLKKKMWNEVRILAPSTPVQTVCQGVLCIMNSSDPYVSVKRDVDVHLEVHYP